MGFAAFDRQRHVAGAGIAFDDLEFGPENGVEDRCVIRRSSTLGAGCKNSLGGEDVLEGFGRSGGPGGAHTDLLIGGAEVVELLRVVLNLRLVAGQRVHDRAREQRAERGAVLGRHVVEVSGCLVAAGARHVFRHHVRVAGNVFADVAGDSASVDVMPAAWRGADDEIDIATFVERGEIALRRCRRGEQAQHHAGSGQSQKCRTNADHTGLPGRYCE